MIICQLYYYCHYHLNSKGLYPLFTNTKPGRLFLHLRWSATPTINYPLCCTDPSCATHMLSCYGPVLKPEPYGSNANALPTELIFLIQIICTQLYGFKYFKQLYGFK